MLKWFWHVIRIGEERLVKRVYRGTVEGNRVRGSPHILEIHVTQVQPHFSKRVYHFPFILICSLKFETNQLYLYSHILDLSVQLFLHTKFKPTAYSTQNLYEGT